MKATVAAAINFIVGFIRDPESCDGSSARLCAVACIFTACAIALICAWRGQINAWLAGVIGALVGGAWAALRERATTIEAATTPAIQPSCSTPGVGGAG